MARKISKLLKLMPIKEQNPIYESDGRFGNSQTQIITPKLWGPYRLIDSPYIYFPALNQVWIAGRPRRAERELILSHEFLHAFTTCGQPAQFLPLLAELRGVMPPPPISGEYFEEFVETVCITYFLVYFNLKIISDYLIGGKTHHYRLVAELIRIARIITHNASSMLTSEESLRQAVAAIDTLLMHIVPYRSGLCLKILSTTTPI